MGEDLKVEDLTEKTTAAAMTPGKHDNKAAAAAGGANIDKAAVKDVFQSLKAPPPPVHHSNNM